MERAAQVELRHGRELPGILHHREQRPFQQAAGGSAGQDARNGHQNDDGADCRAAKRRYRAAQEVRHGRHHDVRRQGRGDDAGRKCHEALLGKLGEGAGARGREDSARRPQGARPVSGDTMTENGGDALSISNSATPTREGIIEWICGTVAKLTLIAMMVIIGAEVVLRNMLHYSWEGTDEVGSYLVVAVTFLSLA